MERRLCEASCYLTLMLPDFHKLANIPLMLTLQMVINTNVYILGAILDTQNVIPAGSV
jgi:hypothetical protein